MKSLKVQFHNLRDENIATQSLFYDAVMVGVPNVEKSYFKSNDPNVPTEIHISSSDADSHRQVSILIETDGQTKVTGHDTSNHRCYINFMKHFSKSDLDGYVRWFSNSAGWPKISGGIGA